MTKSILVISSILYFLLFIVDILIFTVEPSYGIYSNIGLCIYIFLWCVPIIYLWRKQQLFINNIAIIIGINIIALVSFFYISETPYAMEIRQERGKQANERARIREEWRKSQESSSGNIQIQK